MLDPLAAGRVRASVRRVNEPWPSERNPRHGSRAASRQLQQPRIRGWRSSVPGVSRGFGSRQRQRPADSWLPPGQYDVRDTWPVLSAEVTPRQTTDDWTMTVDGLVAERQNWTWDDLHLL